MRAPFWAFSASTSRAALPVTQTSGFRVQKPEKSEMVALAATRAWRAETRGASVPVRESDGMNITTTVSQKAARKRNMILSRYSLSCRRFALRRGRYS